VNKQKTEKWYDVHSLLCTAKETSGYIGSIRIAVQLNVIHIHVYILII